MNYAPDPEQTRQRIAERDGHACRVCHAPVGEEGLVWPPGGGERVDEALALVCRWCYADLNGG